MLFSSQVLIQLLRARSTRTAVWEILIRFAASFKAPATALAPHGTLPLLGDFLEAHPTGRYAII